MRGVHAGWEITHRLLTIPLTVQQPLQYRVFHMMANCSDIYVSNVAERGVFQQLARHPGSAYSRHVLKRTCGCRTSHRLRYDNLARVRCHEQESRAITRLLHEARLPQMKTLGGLIRRFRRVGTQIRALPEGDHVTKAGAVPLVGVAGAGKIAYQVTHPGLARSGLLGRINHSA